MPSSTAMASRRPSVPTPMATRTPAFSTRPPHSSRPVSSTPRVPTPARHISISASSTLDSRLRQRSITVDPNRASSNRMILSDMAPGLLSDRGFHVQATENRTKAGPCPFHRNPQPNLRKKTGVIHLSVAVAQFTVAEEPERNLEIIDGFARDAAAGDREADLITAELSRECLDSAR